MLSINSWQEKKKLIAAKKQQEGTLINHWKCLMKINTNSSRQENVTFAVDHTKKIIKQSKDRCHTTRKYRGSPHQHCDISHFWWKVDKIKKPVILHDLRGYDSHIIMQEIGEIAKKHIYNNNL